MRKYIIIFFLILSSKNLFSQGFDWQYSYRGHSTSPQLFLGINTAYGVGLQIGDINFSENIIPCCRFSEGFGTDLKLGILAEYWMDDGINSIIGSVNYKNKSSLFAANPDPIYYLNDTLFTELEFRNTISFLHLNIAGKHRIDLSHYFVSLGLGVDLLLTNTYEHSEIITSSEMTFNDGTRRRKIDNGEVGSLSSIVLSPEIKFGYDFNLGLGLYGSALMSFSLNINEIANDTRWRAYSLSLGINVVKGIF